MLLCDVMGLLTDDTSAQQALIELGDLSLLAGIETRAAGAGVGVGAYTAWAVRTYADNAAAEEWTTLLGLLGRADDPGAVCLRRALGYVLAATEAGEAAGG